MKKLFFLLVSFSLILSCKTIKKTWKNANVFPVSQDKELGLQVYEEIKTNTAEYPQVPEQGNEELYSYVNRIVKKILSTGKVAYANDFPWKVTIINNDKIQNAFATPGGYIFLYTGLMKFLDSEDQLAGVLGHEIAHAANRHSTKQLTKLLGLQVLADAALGKKETIKQVATALIGLSFSRDHETEADSFSVKYLCATDYVASGSAGFFKKIEGQSTPPEWLSTHPSPSNRIKKIENKSKELGCLGNQNYKTKYEQIKLLINKIPPPPTSTSKPPVKTDLPSKTGDTKNPKDSNANTPDPNSNTPASGKKIVKPK